MRFTKFKPFLFCSFMAFFAPSAQAQTETLHTFNSFFGWSDFAHKVGNQVIFTSKNKDQFWKFDLTTGNLDTLLTDSYNYTSIEFNSRGFFCIDYEPNGTNGKHFIHFIDTLGSSISPVEINDYSSSNPVKYKPRFPIICNDRYYINGYFNNQHCVWESNGTTAGTQIIFQSNNPIHSIQELNDTLLIVEDGTTDFHFHKYTFGQSTQQFASAAQLNFTTDFYPRGKSDAHIYFNVKISTNDYNLYRIDFNNPPELFRDGRVAEINFNDSLFTLRANQEFFLRGNLSNPLVLDTIYPEKAIQSPDIMLDYSYENGYYRMRAIDYGHEIVYLADDSLYQVEASVFGPGSGVPLNVDGYRYSNGQPTNAVNYFTESDSTLYTILTNGNDPNYYLYRLNGTSSQSLFSVENPEEIRQICSSNGFIYWIEGDDQTIALKRRSLTAPIEQQPAQDTQSDTWFRQFVIGKGINISFGDIIQIFPQGIQSDSLDNTVIGFNMQERAVDCRFLSSDTNVMLKFKGTSIYVKYDPLGNFMWANGIGDPEGIFLKENKFRVRKNGNVVIYGQFFNEAYFDNDSLNAPLAGIFLAELDGNTGVVLWKKRIAQAVYVNYFDSDQLELDEEGNIYIATSYNGNNTSIGGMNIWSDSSPATAVAKFDPTGNVLWAKPLPTPLTNLEARTRVMDYSETFKKLTVVQSQGYFNIQSSCMYHDWGYFIQELDPDGTILGTQALKGNDIGSMTVGMRTSNDQLFGMGYFRGEIEAGDFELQTDPSGDCFRTEAFGVLYDGKEVVGTSKSDNNTFFPLDVSANEENIFVLGVSQTKELVILKFSREAEYVGYKRLYQETNPFDWGERIFLDVSKDYIALLGTNFRKDTMLNVAPTVNSLPSLSVLKTTNSGFINDASWIQSSPIPLKDNLELIIYPNPFDDYIEVLFAKTDMSYDTYEIVDINGRLIQNGAISELQLQTIELPDVGAGMYLISFYGSTEMITKQLIKY